MIKIAEEAYLAAKGFGKNSMGECALHKNIPEGKIRKKLIETQAKKDREIIKKRDELRQEYKNKVETGIIRPPTRMERLIDTAQGHCDNESTQAAIRLLKKIKDWEG